MAGRNNKPLLRACAAFIAALLVVGLAGCASTRIGITRLQPPEYDIKSGKTLAVLDLAPAQDNPDSGRAIASALVGKLAPSGFYKLMERSQIAQVIKEQEFGKSYYVDPNSAKEVGKILGVDYVIVGEVSGYSSEDEKGIEKVQRLVESGQYVRDSHGRLRASVRTVWVDEPMEIRRGSVAANFRMVNVETGEIIAGSTETAQFNKKGVGAAEIGRLPALSEIVNNLTNEVADKFARRIAPHPVQDVKTLEYGKSPQVKHGVTLARNGLWDEAVAAWQEAQAANPADPATYNNLGVAYERLGRFDDAEEQYRKALQLKPDSQLYMENVRHVQYLKNLYKKKPSSS
jgi:curli biogenesis system outer membrane secretion channel CsgG